MGKHHRALMFDGLPDDALAFHTDFSAKYACVGQDVATFSHPNTCNQIVFLVTFRGENGEQVNEAWHLFFGGKRQAELQS